MLHVDLRLQKQSASIHANTLNTVQRVRGYYRNALYKLLTKLLTYKSSKHAWILFYRYINMGWQRLKIY